jgi:hypothetical protein
MSRDRTSQRMSHRRSDECIRIGILVAYSTVEWSQTRRGGRSIRAPSPRLRRCQGVPIARCCPWLRAARHRQPGAGISCGSRNSRTVRGRGHARTARRLLSDFSHSTRRPGNLSSSSSCGLCTCYTIGRLPYAMRGRMIPLYQSSTVRDVPLRLYGSLRAVNVLLASCAPHCTALAPPAAWLVWLHAGATHCRKVRAAR